MTVEVSTADELSDIGYGANVSMPAEATLLDGIFTAGDLPPGIATLTASHTEGTLGTVDFLVREDANTSITVAPAPRK